MLHLFSNVYLLSNTNVVTVFTVKQVQRVPFGQCYQEHEGVLYTEYCARHNGWVKNQDVQNHCNMYVFLRCQIFCPNVYKHALCFQIARTICIKVVPWIVLCFTAPEVSVNNGLMDHLLKLPATGKLNAECIFVYKTVLDCCLTAVL